MSFMLTFPHTHIMFLIRFIPIPPVSLPCCLLPLPTFQQEDSGCVLDPPGDTELNEKAGFHFSPIKIIAFKHKIVKTLGYITNFKV